MKSARCRSVSSKRGRQHHTFLLIKCACARTKNLHTESARFKTYIALQNAKRTLRTRACCSSQQCTEVYAGLCSCMQHHSLLVVGLTKTRCHCADRTFSAIASGSMPSRVAIGVRRSGLQQMTCESCTSMLIRRHQVVPHAPVLQHGTYS
jgi:hypothetical protein